MSDRNVVLVDLKEGLIVGGGGLKTKNLRIIQGSWNISTILTSVSISARERLGLLSLDSKIGSHSSKKIIALWILASRNMNLSRS